MTQNTRSKPAPCKACGAGITIIQEKGKKWTGQRYSAPTNVSVIHYCDPVPGKPSRFTRSTARDMESAVAAWNRWAQKEQT
jgi:hypothetical protein